MQIETFGKPVLLPDVPAGTFFIDARTGSPAVCGIAVAMSSYQGAILFHENGPLYVNGFYSAVHVVEKAILQCDPLSAVVVSEAQSGAVVRNSSDDGAFMMVADKNRRLSSYSLTSGQYVPHVNTADAYAFSRWEVVVPRDDAGALTLFKFDSSPRCAKSVA